MIDPDTGPRAFGAAGAGSEMVLRAVESAGPGSDTTPRALESPGALL